MPSSPARSAVEVRPAGAIAEEPSDRPSSRASTPGPEDAALLLARAVHQCHTYPLTNPRVIDAIAACRRALLAATGGADLRITVTREALLVADSAVASNGVIEQELARRLRRCHIASLAIDGEATARDLTRFCLHLIRCSEHHHSDGSIADGLAEDGIGSIAVTLLVRPEVLNLGAPSIANKNLMEVERRRRSEAPPSNGPNDYLFQPDKGWVRLDPAAEYDNVSLTDLAILVEDPVELATMLTRLTGDAGPQTTRDEAALEQRFSDVTSLFASLEPRLARVMFAKLARAVLAMKPERRQRLLRKTVLPGLLDGEIDGSILVDFPDPDLAESLCLLLDLETAAPELVTTALDRLGLEPERRAAVEPLLDARLHERAASASGRSGEEELDQYARKLTRIDSASGKDFSEFAAFDLAVDDATTTAVDQVRHDIGATDAHEVGVLCLLQLIRIQPNPEVVAVFLEALMTRFAELEAAARWRDVASGLTQLKEIGDVVADRRPEVAAAVTEALHGFGTPSRAAALMALHRGDAAGRDAFDSVLDALGPVLAPAFVSLLVESPGTTEAGVLVEAMSQRAAMFGPALAVVLPYCSDAARPVVIKVLGFAGAGFETDLGAHLDGGDERVVREALRALTRVGSPQAATLVAARAMARELWRASAAVEALWHFPPAPAQSHVRALLARREFVRRHPEQAARFIDRATRDGSAGLDEVLRPLMSLRFHFWNPALVRVARKAATVLAT